MSLASDVLNSQFEIPPNWVFMVSGGIPVFVSWITHETADNKTRRFVARIISVVLGVVAASLEGGITEFQVECLLATAVATMFTQWGAYELAWKDRNVNNKLQPRFGIGKRDLPPEPDPIPPGPRWTGGGPV